MANISCGYYRPHRDTEIISIPEVFLTTDFVNELILTLAGKIWVNSDYAKKDFVKKTYGTTSNGYNAGNHYRGKGWNDPKATVWCHTTQAWVKPEDRVPNDWDDPTKQYDYHLQKYVKKSWLETVHWNGLEYVRKTTDDAENEIECPDCTAMLTYVPFTDRFYCIDCDKHYMRVEKV